jgi:hypothetical protein
VCASACAVRVPCVFVGVMSASLPQHIIQSLPLAHARDLLALLAQDDVHFVSLFCDAHLLVHDASICTPRWEHESTRIRAIDNQQRRSQWFVRCTWMAASCFARAASSSISRCLSLRAKSSCRCRLWMSSLLRHGFVCKAFQSLLLPAAAFDDFNQGLTNPTYNPPPTPYPLNPKP